MSKVAKNQQQIIEFLDICSIKDGIICSPTLYSFTQKTGKYYHWTIYVSIDDLPITRDMIVDKTVNWTDKNLPKYYTKSGQLADETNKKPAVSTSDDTLFHNGKNIGKANYTTALTQALCEARTKYNKKVKQGYLPNMEEMVANTSRVYPMALHDVSKANNWRHVIFPCYVQTKFNGTRMIAYDGEVYSRARKDINTAQHILDALEYIFKDHPYLYIDGEYYKHGDMLQHVSGKARREEDASDMQYYIFDTFTLNKETYDERRLRTASLGALNQSPDLIFVPDVLVNNREELDAEYERILELGFEGLVIRNFNSLYEYGPNKEIRSYSTLKYKPRPDMEFEVVGYTQGERGKEVGQVIWICTIDNYTVTEMYDRYGDKYPNMAKTLDDVTASHTFSVTPNWPQNVRRAVFTYLEAGYDEFSGQQATISFSDTSSDAKPQQPKFLQFRDIEFNQKLIDNAIKFCSTL